MDDPLGTTLARDPPPGRESNLVNPESISYQLVTVIAVTTALMVLLTASRTYVRLRVTKSFGLDDWFCLAATAATLAYAGLVLSLCDKPGNSLLGVHMWDVSQRKYITFMKLSVFDTVLHRFANTLIKVAFLLFYLRLFGPVRHIRLMAWAGLGAVVTFCIAYIIIYVTACVPHAGEDGGYLDDRYWSRCAAIGPNTLLAGCYFGVITDFYIMFMPMSQVKGLALPKKRKLGIGFIFLTGLIAVGAGTANLVIQYYFDIDDMSWSAISMYSTCYLELSMGLVALSLPVVLALFVSRLTDLGRTLSSWVRRSRENLLSGGSGSSSSLSPEGSRVVDENAQQLPRDQQPPGAALPGLRKFIRNLNRSRAQTSEPGTVLSTFNDLTTADFSYHAQLKKTLQPIQTTRSSKRYEKVP
ncbi:integral membrane protein [Apiospora arundinis]|uniref:Integral membrane protein n=1 Tax=Apiospora arundinis TaxID=335852 RepID=A0ABR2IT07_9PEZI